VIQERISIEEGRKILRDQATHREIQSAVEEYLTAQRIPFASTDAAGSDRERVAADRGGGVMAKDMKPDARLNRAIRDRKEYAECNYDFDDDEEFTDDDAIDELMGECGKGRDGYCSLAGTEYCDWDCPFS
jgi:hypothetical protein